MTAEINITEQYSQLFSRNLGIMTEEEQARLAHTCVAIAGVGGVGGIQLVTLARAGIGRFHIADPEKFGASDHNRQYGALMSNRGVNKAAVMADLLREINPECEVTTFEDGVNAGNIGAFLEGADVVIDAIEYFTVEEKVRLAREARARGQFLFTSPIIGLGSTVLVFAPQGMTYEEYMQYDPATGQINPMRLCPLYPEYLDKHLYLDAIQRKRAIPSFAGSATLSGSILATEVVLFLLGKRQPLPAPKILLVDLFRRRFDVLDMAWQQFWTDFSREAYDYIALVPEHQAMLNRVVELAGTGKQVLDAGCGTGNLVLKLAASNTVTGIDFSPGMVERATEKTRHLPNVTIGSGDVMALSFPDHSFDVVTNLNVLFNLSDPAAALREMCRVLKPGGLLITCSPLKDRAFSPDFGARVMDDCRRGNVPPEKIEKVWRFQMQLAQTGGLRFTPTEEEIVGMVASAGFRVDVVEETYFGTNFLIRAEKC